MERDYEFRKEIILVEQFRCRLTTDEHNAFIEFMNVHPKWLEFRECHYKFRSAECALIAGNATREQFESEQRAANVALDACVPIAKAWYQENIAPKVEKVVVE